MIAKTCAPNSKTARHNGQNTNHRNKEKIMPLNFKFNEPASIEHINIRKEKGGDGEVLAIDVKVHGKAPAAILAEILGTTQAKALAFWDKKTDEQRPAYNGLTELITWTEFDKCEVRIEGREFKGAKVRKFRLKPENGFSLDTTLQVSLSDIHDSDVSYLCEKIRDDVDVSIATQPDFFDAAPE